MKFEIKLFYGLGESSIFFREADSIDILKNKFSQEIAFSDFVRDCIQRAERIQIRRVI